MERSKGITIYGILIIFSGVYNLLGAGSYKQFSVMFSPLATILIVLVYAFTLLYGICSVYCGARILRLEDWARKLMVGLTAVSVIAGLLLNRTVMANFKEFLKTDEIQVPPGMAGTVYVYTVIFTALIMLYELSVIYFFTRPKVVEQFRDK